MHLLGKTKRGQKRILEGLAAVLLLAAVFRVVTERAFFAHASMEGAFAVLTPEESRGTVTMTGRYLPPPYGFSEEKLLRYFGEEIGLTVDGTIREVSYEGRQEYVYEKLAAQAHSVIKVVYLEEPEAYYVCAEIALTGDQATASAGFRKRINKAAEKIGLSEVSTNLELCGIYEGEIPLGKKDEITDLLLSELYAQPVYENRQNANYTVYAYTGAVEEYITVEKKKINVQVAVYYDKDTDCTEVVLATPLGLR